MKVNDIVDLIQYNDPIDPDDDFGTIAYPEESLVAINVPVAVGSIRDQNKLLQNQDTNWEQRVIVQHKIFELKNLPVDAIRFHSTGKVMDVYWNNSTGVDQTISYKCETRDVRRSKESDPIWKG